MAAAAAKKGATKKQAAPASKNQSPPKKEPARSITGSNNSAAVALRELQNQCRGYAPGYEGMVGLFVANNPKYKLNSAIRPAIVMGWYTRIVEGEEQQTRQTSAARRSRPARAKTTTDTGEQGEAEQPAQHEKLKSAAAGGGSR